MGLETAPAIPELIDAINYVDISVGTAAVAALGAIGPEADEAIPALIELLEKEDWTFYNYAADALANITGQDFGEDAAVWRRWWGTQP